MVPQTPSPPPPHGPPALYDFTTCAQQGSCSLTFETCSGCPANAASCFVGTRIFPQGGQCYLHYDSQPGAIDLHFADTTVAFTGVQFSFGTSNNDMGIFYADSASGPWTFVARANTNLGQQHLLTWASVGHHAHWRIAHCNLAKHVCDGMGSNGWQGGPWYHSVYWYAMT